MSKQTVNESMRNDILNAVIGYEDGTVTVRADALPVDEIVNDESGYSAFDYNRDDDSESGWVDESTNYSEDEFTEALNNGSYPEEYEYWAFDNGQATEVPVTSVLKDKYGEDVVIEFTD